MYVHVCVRIYKGIRSNGECVRGSTETDYHGFIPDKSRFFSANVRFALCRYHGLSRLRCSSSIVLSFTHVRRTRGVYRREYTSVRGKTGHLVRPSDCNVCFYCTRMLRICHRETCLILRTTIFYLSISKYSAFLHSFKDYFQFN